MNVSYAACVGVVSIGCAAFAAPAWFDADLAAARIARVHAASGLPGISAAILRINDTEPGTAVAGVRRLEHSEPVTCRDRFHIGSNGKAVTSAVLARLVDAGKLSWDTTLTEVFGERFPIDPSYADVTVREVLCMRAGMPGLETLDEMLPYLGFPGSLKEQRAAITREIVGAPRVFIQGVEAYSNASLTVAGAIAEVVTGRSWEELATEYLGTELGIVSEVGWPGSDGSEQPWGHIRLPDGWLQIDPVGDIQFPAAISPAGNLSMSVSDLARFQQAQLRSLADLSNSSGLSKSAVAELHDAKGFTYAMGWTDLGLATGPSEGWIGSTDVFYSLAFIDRARGHAIAVAVNGSDPESGGAEVTTMALAAEALARMVCPSDITLNGAVDDDDFLIFAAAYDVMLCDDASMDALCVADLNGDGVVDDADFSRFVGIYDVGGCE